VRIENELVSSYLNPLAILKDDGNIALTTGVVVLETRSGAGRLGAGYNSSGRNVTLSLDDYVYRDTTLGTLVDSIAISVTSRLSGRNDCVFIDAFTVVNLSIFNGIEPNVSSGTANLVDVLSGVDKTTCASLFANAVIVVTISRIEEEGRAGRSGNNVVATYPTGYSCRNVDLVPGVLTNNKRVDGINNSTVSKLCYRSAISAGLRTNLKRVVALYSVSSSRGGCTYILNISYSSSMCGKLRNYSIVNVFAVLTLAYKHTGSCASCIIGECLVLNKLMTLACNLYSSFKKLI
jgi:hypothetical protein